MNSGLVPSETKIWALHMLIAGGVLLLPDALNGQTLYTHTHTFISMSISISICESEALLAQLCLTICDHVDCSHLAPLSMGFSRQERLSG